MNGKALQLRDIAERGLFRYRARRAEAESSHCRGQALV